MLNVGDEAPDFELQNQDGEKVSLSDFENEYVVVYFYPRANTPGCTTEACEFRDASNEFEAHDATVLGISDDPISDLEEFADDHDLSFPLLSDEDGAVASAYDSYGEKNMFGNTFDGVFRNSYVVAPDGTIAFAYEGVSPEGHAEEILSDLKAHRESSD
ncbi:peroxiredoxin [Halogeometricum borinquense DSM 11551]|uniref:thioredoxin-dependent peroxiredoxin n=2 Tax=Halogeometricum borinquense TaxID=60847 RepID=E4NQQ5_HALBP|nr:thioredoxin-dependent thiol peroxidase [Halogeometricum borinquense]ADQ66743.1 Peroxiredoxin [Halogeometricum borinquense DSM 11551]ELY30252.1 peroxiredoxin [Halogeometricum borinquense DSM 11551]RYJ14582.1 thioredoxin-dependent thiol peroxidase [Halogeometricum borinquense]